MLDTIRFILSTLLTIGGLFVLVSGVLGIFRFKNSLSRIHAAALFEIAAINARRALDILRHGGRGVIVSGILIGRSLLLRIIALQLFFKVLHIKRLAVTAAAAKAQAVGLIQLAIILAVVALQEGFLHALNGQVQAPVFAVYADLRVIVG